MFRASMHTRTPADRQTDRHTHVDIHTHSTVDEQRLKSKSSL